MSMAFEVTRVVPLCVLVAFLVGCPGADPTAMTQPDQEEGAIEKTATGLEPGYYSGETTYSHRMVSIPWFGDPDIEESQNRSSTSRVEISDSGVPIQNVTDEEYVEGRVFLAMVDLLEPKALGEVVDVSTDGNGVSILVSLTGTGSTPLEATQTFNIRPAGEGRIEYSFEYVLEKGDNGILKSFSWWSKETGILERR